MFVERMAMTWAELGFPRMPARVLMALMVADEPGLTAGELAERLGVSPAAISGGVRYLQQIDIVVREPVPGSRRDRYRMPDDAWFYASTAKGGVYKMLSDITAEGVRAVGGEGTPSGDRLAEMRDFFVFFQDELDGMLERWEERRRSTRPGLDRDPG